MNIRQRIRCFLAILALFSAMWTAVDLHHHDTGWHTSAECNLCMLENAVAHGFAPQADIHDAVDIMTDTAIIWLASVISPGLLQSYPIRAPPVFSDLNIEN